MMTPPDSDVASALPATEDKPDEILDAVRGLAPGEDARGGRHARPRRKQIDRFEREAFEPVCRRQSAQGHDHRDLEDGDHQRALDEFLDVVEGRIANDRPRRACRRVFQEVADAEGEAFISTGSINNVAADSAISDSARGLHDPTEACGRIEH
jgi:hypothetical protein